MRREHLLTNRLKKFDSKLVCRKMDNGNLAIFRKDKRYDAFNVDGTNVLFFKDAPHYIFSLTNDWTPHGTPVERSYDNILERLQFGDAWNRNGADDVIKGNEKAIESRDRDIKNKFEAIAGEAQPRMKKALNDYNLSSMSNTALTKNQKAMRAREKL